ncbi:MAG TPA: OsmC family protein [Vicinamibacterales bacterium]|nr:OsmC family protein [Vicinamibacterales bacterium]
MITATSDSANYRTTFSNGAHTAYADASPKMGGADAGFRPHDLVEASLACCINIWLRMYSQRHEIPLEAVTTTVEMDKTETGVSKFKWNVTLTGDMTPEQHERLIAAAAACPVRRTLEQTLQFPVIE